MIYLNGSTVIIPAYTRFYFHAKEAAKEECKLNPEFPDDFRTGVTVGAFSASRQHKREVRAARQAAVVRDDDDEGEDGS